MLPAPQNHPDTTLLHLGMREPQHLEPEIQWLGFPKALAAPPHQGLLGQSRAAVFDVVCADNFYLPR